MGLDERFFPKTRYLWQEQYASVSGLKHLTIDDLDPYTLRVHYRFAEDYIPGDVFGAIADTRLFLLPSETDPKFRVKQIQLNFSLQVTIIN